MEFTRCFGCMEPVKAYPCPHCGFDPGAAGQPENTLRPGTILKGRYIAGAPRTRSSKAIVYTAWDLKKERKAAIAEYFPGDSAFRQGGLQCCFSPAAQAETDREKQAFLQQAGKLSSLSRISQVPACTDTFEGNGTVYIVTDLTAGESLSVRLGKAGSISWKEAKNRFFPAIQAMEKIHGAGVLHRGLCPDSLVMNPDGSVMILDFTFSSDLAGNGGITPPPGPFSPPELYIPGGKAGTWSDVYSLAAVLYLALTGKAPVAALDRLSQDSIDWLCLERAGIPKHVSAALQKGMILKESARTQTMAAFLKDLRSGAGLPRPVRKR
ncbi:MAG: serine/threonine protein kinase [Faecousia sp.]